MLEVGTVLELRAVVPPGPQFIQSARVGAPASKASYEALASTSSNERPLALIESPVSTMTSNVADVIEAKLDTLKSQYARSSASLVKPIGLTDPLEERIASKTGGIA
jgi:hypothetical protein